MTAPRLAVIVLAGTLAIACGNSAGTSTEGPVLFAKLCATCHGPTGKPADAMVQTLGVRDLTDPVVRQHLTVARVDEQIRRGSENHRMPGFDGLATPEQIAALAAYVASPAFVAPAK